MPYYMIQLGYRPDAWDALIDHPVNRLDVVKPAIESLEPRASNDPWVELRGWRL